MLPPEALELISIGTDVTIFCPIDDQVDYISYLRGPVTELLATGRRNALYVVSPREFRPEGEDWRPYDGVPLVRARQTVGEPMLLWVRVHI